MPAVCFSRRAGHHIFPLPIEAMPNSPLGRRMMMTRTRPQTVIATESPPKYWIDSVSARPTTRPPAMAPQIDPMPPSTIAAIALVPTLSPMKGETSP